MRPAVVVGFDGTDESCDGLAPVVCDRYRDVFEAMY